MADRAHSTSRRALLAGLATSTVLTLPVLAGEPHPDAELLDLERRRVEVQTAADEAQSRWGALTDSITLPEAPDALLLRDEDRVLKLAVYAVERDDGRMWYAVEPIGVERRLLRRKHWRWQRRPTRPGDGPLGTDWIETRVPWPEAQARADEIVAAWDAWVAEKDRIHEASGWNAAGDEWDRLDDLLEEIEYAIWATTAHTSAGLLVKARLAQRDFDEDNTPPPELMAGIVRDILAMQVA